MLEFPRAIFSSLIAREHSPGAVSKGPEKRGGNCLLCLNASYTPDINVVLLQAVRPCVFKSKRWDNMGAHVVLIKAAKMGQFCAATEKKTTSRD